MALRLFQDSHDMLVIDLDSLREHAAEIFKRLHQHRNTLRRFCAKDMRDGSDEEFNEFLAEGCNKHFDALFPDGEPYMMDSVMFQWDWESTARDVADLIVLGGIDEAVSQYGFVGEHDDNRLRYSYRRRQFFDSGGKLTD